MKHLQGILSIWLLVALQAIGQVNRTVPQLPAATFVGPNDIFMVTTGVVGQAGSTRGITTSNLFNSLINQPGSPSFTVQGNNFNGPSQLIQLDATGGLPAVGGTAVSNSFRFVQLGDTQYLTNALPQWTNTINYLLAQKPSAVFQPGDLADGAFDSEYIAQTNQLWRLVNAGIPLITVPGNHDNNRARWEQYMSPLLLSEPQMAETYTVGQTYDGIVMTQSISGLKLVYIGIGPFSYGSAPVLAWMQSMAAKYHDRLCIVVVHGFIGQSGTAVMTPWDPWYLGGDIYQTNFVAMTNLVQVLCGHEIVNTSTYGPAGRVPLVGNAGNTYNGLMFNFQCSPPLVGNVEVGCGGNNSGLSWIHWYEWEPAANIIHATTWDNFGQTNRITADCQYSFPIWQLSSGFVPNSLVTPDGRNVSYFNRQLQNLTNQLELCVPVTTAADGTAMNDFSYHGFSSSSGGVLFQVPQFISPSNFPNVKLYSTNSGMDSVSALHIVGATNAILYDLSGTNYQGFSNVTLSAWVRTTSSTFPETAMARHNSGTSGQWLLEMLNSTTAEFFVITTSGRVTQTATTAAVNDGQWHLLTGVYDGANQTIYFDGKSVGQAAQTGMIVTNTAINFIINGFNGGGAGWAGDLDDINCWSRALSASEVALLYQTRLSVADLITEAHQSGMVSGNGSGLINVPALLPMKLGPPNAARIGGVQNSVTNHFIENVNGVLSDYWGDGQTSFSIPIDGWAGLSVPGGLSVTVSPYSVVAANTAGFFKNNGSGVTSWSTDGSSLINLNASALSSGTVPTAQMPAFSGGDVTSSAGSGVLTIGSGAVSLAKMAPFAANSVMGNNTGSPATPLALTPSQVLDIIGATRGSIPERAFGGWTQITPGPAGQPFLSSGPGADSGYGLLGLSAMANIAGNTVLGNSGGSPAAPAALSSLPESFISGLPSDLSNRVSTNDGRAITLSGSFAVISALNGTTLFFDPANNAWGIQQTNGLESVYTNGIHYDISATNTMWVQNLVALTNLSAEFFNPLSMTTAQLPSWATNGARAYATDCITSQGVGSWVEFDGVNWRLPDKTLVTTDIPTFIYPYSYTNYSVFTTPISWNFILPNESVYTSSPGRGQALTGTGAGTGLGGSSAYGPFMTLATGTTATGGTFLGGPYNLAMAAGHYQGSGGRYEVSAMTTATDKYYVVVGLTGTIVTTIPTRGCYFLFDQCTNTLGYGTIPTGATTQWTNDWLAVTKNTATSTNYVDTGVAASTSSYSDLWVTYTNGAALFYIGKTLKATITTSLPTTSVYANCAGITKTLGTTSVTLNEAVPGFGVRFPQVNP